MFVSEFSIWVSTAHEQYKLVKKVLENSKQDPPSEPYRSKYAAKEILNRLASDIEKKFKTYGNIQVKLLQALFNFEIGLISIETDEVSAGCEALIESWESIKDYSNDPEGCHLSLKILNQLGIIWSERGDYPKALEYLTRAETVYNSYKSSHEMCPYDSEDMFVLDNHRERDWAIFEKTFTHTLYYLAQVYEHCDENDKSANCCRETLKRQRNSGDYDVNDWALNCATLSQCYIKKQLFEEALHLLCCASEAAIKKENELNEVQVDEEKDVWGDFHHVKASISCCWIKYCIAVLQNGKTNTIAEHAEIRQSQSIFRLIDDENIVMMEKLVPTHVSGFEEAKNVFLFAVKHVTEAKLHYTLNQYANNYVSIVQDHCTLYKYLAFYEIDPSRQCKMYKRCIDMLEDVLRKLNPQYYLLVCRQLQFELGEIYYEMMDTKLKVVKSNEKPKSQAIQKINSLILQGITHFTGFLRSFNDKDGKDPDAFSEDNTRPALIAYFYLGRFHSNLIENDSNRRLHNLTKSEECYKFIVNYVEKNPEALCYIEKEYPVAKEMVELMPERISQITGSTLF